MRDLQKLLMNSVLSGICNYNWQYFFYSDATGGSCLLVWCRFGARLVAKKKSLEAVSMSCQSIESVCFFYMTCTVINEVIRAQ